MAQSKQHVPLAAADFLALGLPQIAYLKEIAVAQGPMVSLHAANGQQIALLKNKDQALHLAWQNGLVPLTLH